MSLTLEEKRKNKPIAIIKSRGAGSRARNTTIYLDLDDEGNSSIELPKNENVLPFFDATKSIRVFISASTGSGKTYLCEQILATSFKKVENIYLFSSVNDKDYSQFNDKLRQIDIDEFNATFDSTDIYDFIENNSVCIFDDILSFRNNKPYIDLRSRLLATGRHKNISVFCIEQQAMNTNKTRDVLLNCEVYIFFPNSSFRSFKKTSIEYLGLTNQKIDELASKKSRWVCINKVYPMYAVLEHGLYIL